MPRSTTFQLPPEIWIPLNGTASVADLQRGEGGWLFKGRAFSTPWHTTDMGWAVGSDQLVKFRGAFANWFRSDQYRLEPHSFLWRADDGLLRLVLEPTHCDLDQNLQLALEQRWLDPHQGGGGYVDLRVDPRDPNWERIVEIRRSPRNMLSAPNVDRCPVVYSYGTERTAPRWADPQIALA